MWPAFTRENDTNIAFAQTTTTRTGLARADCDWWDPEFVP